MINGGVRRDPNAIAAQNTCEKMRGGKLVKVKKWQLQSILCICSTAKTLGSIETPLTTLVLKNGDIVSKFSVTSI